MAGIEPATFVLCGLQWTIRYPLDHRTGLDIPGECAVSKHKHSNPVVTTVLFPAPRVGVLRNGVLRNEDTGLASQKTDVATHSSSPF